MYKLLIASFLAVAAALPLEDTAEVAEAKAAFNAAEAGEHAALAPVNADTQAAQIASAYLADDEEVAAAKAAFKAAFDEAAAGGLAAKQAPAPVHEIPAPVALAAPVAAPALPYAVNALNVLGYPHIAGAYAAAPVAAPVAATYAAHYAAPLVGYAGAALPYGALPGLGH